MEIKMLKLWINRLTVEQLLINCCKYNIQRNLLPRETEQYPVNNKFHRMYTVTSTSMNVELIDKRINWLNCNL